MIRQLEQVNLASIVKLDEVIPAPNEIDKGWLTAVLKRTGALASGEILSVAVGSSASTNAHIARIRIGYGADTQGEPPQSLILKTVEAGTGFVNDSEVNYYARDYVRLADAPIPKCYAAHAAGDGSYSILIEDLSDTHEKVSKPNLEYGLAVATALARLHAFAWGEERIHQLGGHIPEKSISWIGNRLSGRSPLGLE